MSLSLLALGAFLATTPQSTSPATQPLVQDLDPPKIGSLRIDQHGNGRATVTWSTDDVSFGWAEYGQGLRPATRVSDPRIGRDHSVQLHGLTPNAVYGLRVHSGDAARNVSSTDRMTFRSGGAVTGNGFEVAGRMRAWFPLTISFPGPMADERDANPNPFLDYRLQVEFTGPDGNTVSVPGFFDGDGSGGSAGRVWRVRFAPHLGGAWSFVARFRKGVDVAIDLSPGAGTPASFDATSGTFEIHPRDPEAEGFYRWGKLLYVSDHYLEFYDGPRFLKGGTNSPENLLAFAGFDNTIDQGGRPDVGLDLGLHRFEPHLQDWGAEQYGGLGTFQDPLFRSRDTHVDAKGLVGALNYLASVHVNSLFFLTMNLGGDGWEVSPFVGYARTAFDKTHYDVSKLAQWNQIFEHAARLGISVQVVLAENEPENRNWLDDGQLGRERKLFYREMVARFGHIPAIKWNIAEECEYPIALVAEFAGYIRDLDPYDHPVGFHVNLLPTTGESQQYDDVLGDVRFQTNSLQAIPNTASDLMELWREKSAEAGRKWVVEFDEQLRGLTDANASELRKLQLYDTLFSGGHIEWYSGYFDLPLGGDLNLEDFRTREEMWNYTWHARKILEEHVPFWLMEPMDELVEGESLAYGGAEVLAIPNYFYLGYFPDASLRGTIDLRHTRRHFRARWYNPRTGEFEGPPGPVIGGTRIAIPPAPRDPGEDWVFLLVPSSL